MKIKLNPIGTNQTEIDLGSKILFFSYQSLVGVADDEHNALYLSKMAEFSRTTKKHVNNWIENHLHITEKTEIKTIPQEELEAMVEI